MTEFKSHFGFMDFANSLSEWRYFHTAKQKEFLRMILQTSESRKRELPKNTILWRAQNGHDYIEAGSDGEKIECPFEESRMKPLKDKASEGRVNPRGLPYLYTAIEADTAIAEIHPNVEDYVSLAQLKVLKPLILIDCSLQVGEATTYYWINEPNSEQKEQDVWREINKAFSRPVVLDINSPYYVSTQIISEMFRSNGVDGILYKSSLCDGHNVALFDLETTEIIHCKLLQVESVTTTYKTKNTYMEY